MNKIYLLLVLLTLSYQAFTAGRPVQIIICVDRGLEDTPVFARGDKGIAEKAVSIDTTNRVCFGGPVSFAVSSFDCQSPSIASEVITLTITPDSTFEIGDALTLDNLVNVTFTDGTSELVDRFDANMPTGNERVAVLSDNGTDVEIEFTRDPSMASSIVLRNARLSSDGSKSIVIPACDPADLAIGAAARIPTLGEWSLIILTFLMMIIGVIAFRENSKGRLIPVKQRVK